MQKQDKIKSTVLYDKVLGCLVGGLIGDAMGSPTEQMHFMDIEKKFGWVDDFESEGTDDTLMKTYLAKALIAKKGHATFDDWATVWCRGKNGDMFGGKSNRFFISVEQTARKLQTNVLPREAALGNMASSSSAMSIAPVGIVNACDPWEASLQAYNVAGLIHIHDVGFCQDAAAAVAAAIAEALKKDTTIENIISAAIQSVVPISGAMMKSLIQKGVELTRLFPNYYQLRKAFYDRSDELFRQIICDSRETMPITFALLSLSGGSAEKAITYSANFGRDSDTIASISGAIAGAFEGASALPAKWMEKAFKTSEVDQEELAESLVKVVISRKEELESTVSNVTRLI